MRRADVQVAATAATNAAEERAASTLCVVSRHRQIDGGLRVVLDTPAAAVAARERIRRDAARRECERGSVIVDVDAVDRRRVAVEWPGRRDGAAPPWEAIAQALWPGGAS